MNQVSQITLSVLMLLGRLEFYTLLVLLLPETWARRRPATQPQVNDQAGTNVDN